MTIHDFVAKLQGVKPAGDHAFIARCPSHKDDRPSLSVAVGRNGSIILKCFAGCSADEVCKSLGLEMSDLMADQSNGHSAKPTILCTYPYHDEMGTLVYEKLRYVPKDFRIRRPNPAKKGDWIYNLKGTRKVLYRLPQLIKAVADDIPVYFVEGEKDVDTLTAAGFVATCNPTGAKERWDDSYNQFFEQSDLTIIPDKDQPGRDLSKQISEAVSPIARSCRIVELPDRNGRKVKDVTDWFDAGRAPPLDQAAEFDQLIQSAPTGDPTEQIWSLKELINYDTQKDQNSIIGMHDGKTTRYLCKGSGGWLIGQSGIGKSSLGIHQGFVWALGNPFFGIHPTRPLRVLIIQSENDQGDCAEATQGVIKAVSKSEEDMAALADRVRIIRCRGRTGIAFISWLDKMIAKFRADLVYIDPLLRFAGIDVSRQDQCTRFLNDSLDPLLASTGVVLIGAHHTGKPKSAKETAGWTIYDLAYSGIGSSELVNWARAISILKLRDEVTSTFELLLAKRGPRAWASHPNGDFTTTIYLQHAIDGLYWNQINPEDLIPLNSKPKDDGGRPSKIQEVASFNLFKFCDACKPEGEGLREIARRLESFMAENRKDISRATACRAIAALVANGKLTKTPDSNYIKGPNA
jgi:5S rRNA maturation endonuclease (ribonuclease M5)